MFKNKLKKLPDILQEKNHGIGVYYMNITAIITSF